MLFIQDEIMKLGGVVLSGQVKSVEITQEATIDTLEDDKGKTKASQPTGYGPAKISVDFILEDSMVNTTQQIADLQRLFKDYGQTAARLLPVVNEDCSARGITEVYFKSLGTKSVTASSGRTATLQLETPVIASIQTETSSAAQGDADSQGTDNPSKSTASNSQGAGTTKTTKDPSKSPVNDVRRVKMGDYWAYIN